MFFSKSACQLLLADMDILAAASEADYAHLTAIKLLREHDALLHNYLYSKAQ